MTLKDTDPHLVEALERLRKGLRFWGVLLLVDAALVGLVLRGSHPLAPLSGVVIGGLALVSTQPLVLAAAAVQLGFGMLRAAFPVAQAFGGDPILILTEGGTIQVIAVVFTRAIFFYTAVTHFLQFRLLYGTARASGPVADLPAIPPMVANRTDLYARWALWSGISSLLAVLAAVALATSSAAAAALDLAGNLAVIGIGFGLGAAFSPTDRRDMALGGGLTGLLGFVAGLGLGRFFFR